jgi:hypothetical protein
MYTNTLFIGQSYMKRRNGEKEKKMRDDCMIIVSVQLREREKGQRRKKWKGGERQMPS